MAEKKTTKKAASKAVPAKVLSDKQIVKNKFKSAECVPIKTGFCIMDQVDEGSPVHAGLAKSEDDAWKLAARTVI